MKNRIFNLLKHYRVKPPYHEIISDVLWKCKITEFSYIKNKAVREYKAQQYFLDKLSEIYGYRGKMDTRIILSSFVHTSFDMDYGDAVYNELRKELYIKYGI